MQATCAHPPIRSLAHSRLLHHLRLLSPSTPLVLQPVLKNISVRASSQQHPQEHKVSMDNSKLQQIIPALRAVVPALSASRQKGQAGKVAIIGGCREYTGAPFFSAISALKVGADLSHVFCTQGAATVIKSYSAELIVHPVLEESYTIRMGGLTIIQKGKADYISDGTSVFVSEFFGSPRRCGGQGDVLSGSVGVFMTWARDFFEKSGSSDAKALVEQSLFRNPAMVAAIGGSLLLRKAAAEAYKQKKRSMVTTNIIELLGDSMEEWFPA